MTDNINNPKRDWSHSEFTDESLKKRLELCSKPEGESGLELAHKMNQEHSSLVSWALDMYLKDSDFSNKKALDIGCGGGATLKALHRRFETLELCGIDYSSDMVELASKETAGFASIREGSVLNLPYMECEFDLVTAVETAYFWPDIVESFKGVLKTLKTSGKFFIIHEMYDDRDNTEYAERNNRITTLSSLNLFTPEGLKEKLIEAGFKKVTYSTLPENNWICYSSTK